MKSTAKTVGIVMIIMVLSRFMSLIQNMLYMAWFGVDNTDINIYSYALYFPNIVFAVLGTALTTVVIPVFAGYMGKGDKERAFKFANDIISISLVFTALLAVVGMLLAPLFPLFTTFKENGYDFAVTALRIMFPVMIFYALNYILQGILQSLGKFNMPAFVSVPSSLVVILYVLFLAPYFGVTGLLVATFIGLSLQGLVLIPPLYKTEYRYKPSFDIGSEDVKKALSLIPPVLIGTSAYQLNIFFNVTMTARFENAVTLMSFVQNLILYSILAFIYSITAVVFPKFTMLAAANDMQGFKQSLSKVLRTVSYFLIPATFGFIALRYPLIDLLVGWGKVTPENVTLAGVLLALYALGVLGVGIKEVVDRAFYSLNDTKKPAINGIVIMAANITLGILFINIIGVYGIPLAYSLSSLLGAVILIVLIRRRIGVFGGRDFVLTLAKMAAASCLMFAVVFPLAGLLSGISSGISILDKLLRLAIPSGAGILIYFPVTMLFKVEEAGDIILRVKNRFGGK